MKIQFQKHMTETIPGDAGCEKWNCQNPARVLHFHIGHYRSRHVFPDVTTVRLHINVPPMKR